MANGSNKIIYIIIGIVLLVVAIPVVLVILGMLGGLFFYMQGTTH